MFLVKCSCGCFFTVKAESLDLDGLDCPNCRKYIELGKRGRVADVFGEQGEPGITIHAIPDNAKLTVTFEP